jgi:hypothetical protein
MKRSISTGEVVISAFVWRVLLRSQSDDRHQNKAEQTDAKGPFHGYMITVSVQSGCMIGEITRFDP